LSLYVGDIRRGNELMYTKQTFAIIKDEIIKQDIVCDNYELANQLARRVYGDDAIAVDSSQYPVGEGDYYINGNFYFKDKKTLVTRENTLEEQMDAILDRKLKERGITQ